MLIQNCAFIVTQNKAREILEKVDVRIKGDQIVEIAKNLSAKGEKVISGGGKILLPGLVNAHTHLGMGGLRGLYDDQELDKWLSLVEKAEEALTSQQVYESTLKGCKEAIRFGTTTVYDSYRFHPKKCIQAIKESKIRALYSAGKDNGSILQLVEGTDITPVLSAHSLYVHKARSDSKKILQEVQSLSLKHGLLKRIHIAETRLERFETLKDTGMLPVEYLESLGFLDACTLLIHCIWLTKKEIDWIGKRKAKIIHCPISNMKTSSGGVMPLLEMWERGITVGLGTDSVVSNNNLDMFEEMKVCALLHKQHRWDPKAVPAQKVLDMATLENAKCLGIDKEVGSIEVGMKADVILLNINLHLQPCTTKNLISNLVYSAQGSDVSDVIIGGRVVLEDQKFVG